MLSDVQKKRIEDVSMGRSINRRIRTEDQIAALRKQIVALSDASKVELVPEMQKLEDTVAAEKKKAKAETHQKVFKCQYKHA